ncbi:MAG: uroporphyrinogen decarboxylase family protein [Thermodesulfobacteriota bacterium]
MKEAEVRLQERRKRVLEAVGMKKPDRVPVVLEYAGFAAQVTNTPMAEYVSTPPRATATMIEAWQKVGDGDAINYGTFNPYALAYLFLSKVRVPGVDLPADELWQVDERELMTREDYQVLLEMGWPAFFKKFLAERVFDDVPESARLENLPEVDVLHEWARLGVPVLAGEDVTTPLELLSGGRTLMGFVTDMFEIPDTVEAAMEEICPHLAKGACARNQSGFPAVWVGGWRAAPSLLSPKLWERFAWPYLKRLVEEVVESGQIALMHLDSNWTSQLARFRELPGGRCILATDGETDLFQAKRILGDHLCLMGDVPASLLYLGEPEEVKDYCRRLIKGLGPEGFILQSGCDIPANARLENVRAMVETALEG